MVAMTVDMMAAALVAYLVEKKAVEKAGKKVALTAMNLAAQWVLKLVVGSVDPKDGYSVVQ